MDASVRKKAELIEAGGVTVDSSFDPYKSRSTAGPGAGLESIFVNIGGHRVRLGVRQASRFRPGSKTTRSPSPGMVPNT